jgi:hypothetical protein
MSQWRTKRVPGRTKRGHEPIDRVVEDSRRAGICVTLALLLSEPFELGISDGSVGGRIMSGPAHPPTRTPVNRMKSTRRICPYLLMKWPRLATIGD